jgi:hypothetical protein
MCCNLACAAAYLARVGYAPLMGDYSAPAGTPPAGTDLPLLEYVGEQFMSDGPSEKRQRSRHRVLKAGIIAFNERRVTLSCTVLDISETGARLRISGPVIAPNTFDLIIKLDGLEAACEVAWRTVQKVAVQASLTQKLHGSKISGMRNILAHRYRLRLNFGHSMLNNVADRYDADERIVGQHRQMTEPSSRVSVS